MWRVTLIYSIVSVCVSYGFKCTSCSYSYDPLNPDADNACVDQPEVFTGYSLLDCEHRCIIRETYNRRMDKVVAYWRHCQDRLDPGHCDGDASSEIVTCFYTCTGELCNSWVRGQLHTVYTSENNSAGAICMCKYFILFVSFVVLRIHVQFCVSRGGV